MKAADKWKKQWINGRKQQLNGRKQWVNGIKAVDKWKQWVN